MAGIFFVYSAGTVFSSEFSTNIYRDIQIGLKYDILELMSPFLLMIL